jgi:hypothetical protein
MKTVVRASTLSEWPDCSRRVAAKVFANDIAAAGYTLRETISGVAAAIGTAVHRGAAVILGEKVALGRMPPAGLGLDAARDQLRELANEGIIYDTMSQRLPDAEKATLRMVVTYRDDLAPWIDPIAVEQRLEAEAETDLILSGQSDVIAREPKAIRDLKTGKAMVPGNHRPQIGSYSLLARAHGIDIERARIDYIRRVSATMDQPPPHTEVYDIDEIETAATHVLLSMARDIKSFREGDANRHIQPGDPWAFLANPNSRLCSPDYCRAFGTAFCREHREK